MAKSSTFACSVITPEHVVLECDATFVALPAHDGELGILRGRAPLVCRLGIGRLRVESGEQQHVFLVDGGFAQMVDNQLSILTEGARRPEELDAKAARQALSEALAMKAHDEASAIARDRAEQRARAQLRMTTPSSR